MNLSAQIREWLKTQDGPRSSTAMANGTGQDRLKVQYAVAVMLRDGVMRRVTVNRPHAYEIAREILSKTEVMAACAEGRRRQCREISEATEARKALEAKARRNERDRIKRAAKAKEKAAKAERAQATIAKMASRARILPQKVAYDPPATKTESVDDWLSRGGKVDVLPSTWCRP